LEYGHYFVFAAVAPLGAGLQVAADTTHDATGLTPVVAALTVAIPVAVYLVALSFLASGSKWRGRRSCSYDPLTRGRPRPRPW
jgi:hypothetical protein